MQELHVNREWFRLTLLWWDKAMSCANSDPAVCELPGSDTAGSAKLEWDGNRFVIEKQFAKQRG
jgi:hypothetical protein